MFAANVWRILKTIQAVGPSSGRDRFNEFTPRAAQRSAFDQG